MNELEPKNAGTTISGEGTASATASAIYGAPHIRDLLDYPGCIDAVARAMIAFSLEGRDQPLRAIIEVQPGKLFGVMPGMLGGTHPFGAKLVSVYPDPGRPGRTMHRGIVILFDRETGVPICQGDAGEITEIRTAAATAFATNVLARPDARRLAIFGCGAQAESHLRALRHVRRFDEVTVWGRSTGSAQAFAGRMRDEFGIGVQVAADPRQAAAGADVICTVTSAVSPILLGEWVEPGTHVNIIGSSHDGPVEVDTGLLLKGRYFVDSRKSALNAASEFLAAKAAGAIDDGYIVAEIGEVAAGASPGRCSDSEITLYKSLGHVVQDLAALDYAHRKAAGPAR